MLQTILGSFGLPLTDPPSLPFMVPVSDNDQLYCLDTTPSGWNPTLPTIVLTHGLGGSSRSRYMLRLSRYLYSKGQRVIRVNLRGCGTGFGFARQVSHAGRSEDLLAVCKLLKEQNPRSPLKVLGFSMSGNIVLKMLGELGKDASALVENALVICPAVDLKAGSIFIARPQGSFFEKYYVNCLLKIIDKKKQFYPDYPDIKFPNPLSIYKFDDLYTAPLSGFANADEYYRLSSSCHIIHEIAIPTKILYALDDPVVPAETIQGLDLPLCVSAYATEHGGHVGYLSWAGSDFWLRWMDKQIIDWLK